MHFVQNENVKPEHDRYIQMLGFGYTNVTL